MKTNYCIAVFVVLAALLGSVFFVEGYADEADATTSGDDGNIHWVISDGTLTISKKEGTTSGKMNDYTGSTLPPWLCVDGQYNKKFIAAVSQVIIGEGVEYVGAYSFFAVDDEYEVTISHSVTKIGKGAFLTSAMQSVTLGNCVEEIEEDAFAATYLESIVIPASVKTIGEDAFRNSMPDTGTVSFLTTVWNINIGVNAFLLQDGGTPTVFPIHSKDNIAKDKLTITGGGTVFLYLPLSTYGVTITSANGIDYATTTIEVHKGDSMTVTIHASTGYYFPADYSVDPECGIAVTRLSDNQIQVSGTPNADTTIDLKPASMIQNPTYDDYEDNWYYLHMLKQRAAQQQTTYTDNSEEETAIVAIAAAGVAAALLGIIVLLYRRP